jgi:diacylglycerol kinase family enzyme
MAIDLGVVQRDDDAHYFAVCCGAGFDARLMADTHAAIKRRWKRAAYLARGLAALPGVRSALHRVTVDGVVHERRAALVLVANCGDLFPPFLRLRDDIAPDDGWFDIMTLRADGTLESLAAFWELVRGRWQRARGLGERVWFGRGRSVRVEVIDGAQQPVQLDGELSGETPFEARLVPGALSVLVDPARVQRRWRHD